MGFIGFGDIPTPTTEKPNRKDMEHEMRPGTMEGVRVNGLGRCITKCFCRGLRFGGLGYR